MEQTNHEEDNIIRDFETGEPLASPYVKILKSYSPHAPACINSSTLRDLAECIELPIRGSMEDYIGMHNLHTPEGAEYVLLGVIQAYWDVNGEPNVSGEIFSEKIMGFLPQDALEELPKVHAYFNSPAPGIESISNSSPKNPPREIEEPIPEDDIPF